ncbi:MAG: hypothetical protein K2W33_03735 [Burkholderiales bacterium]|nr:hypothetical protein [Burkholderiales bacterium]
MSASTLPTASYATRLLAASSRLSEPGRSLFERLFIRGESEEVICRELNLSADSFNQVRSSTLRTLMIAAQ